MFLKQLATSHNRGFECIQVTTLVKSFFSAKLHRDRLQISLLVFIEFKQFN